MNMRPVVSRASINYICISLRIQVSNISQQSVEKNPLFRQAILFSLVLG